MQENPDRLSYEVQGIAKFLCSCDREAVSDRLSVMPDVIEVLETARIKAGILFPGDER